MKFSEKKKRSKNKNLFSQEEKMQYKGPEKQKEWCWEVQSWQ